jgi:hypothetical protein
MLHVTVKAAIKREKLRSLIIARPKLSDRLFLWQAGSAWAINLISCVIAVFFFLDMAKCGKTYLCSDIGLLHCMF